MNADFPIPAGFALAPLEPIEAMLRAAVIRHFGQSSTYDDENPEVADAAEEQMAEVWRAMLAVALKPPIAAVVGEPVAQLFAIADELHGALDKQTYDEKRKADWDLPDDHEFCVTITAAQERALSQAIIAYEKINAPSPATDPAAVVGVEAKSVGGNTP